MPSMVEGHGERKSREPTGSQASRFAMSSASQLDMGLRVFSWRGERSVDSVRCGGTISSFERSLECVESDGLSVSSGIASWGGSAFEDAPSCVWLKGQPT